jgi:hypothetical protein
MAAVAAMAMTGTQAGQKAHPMATAARARAAAVAARARAVAVTVAAVTSDGFLFTAQEGDADDREKDRDTK